MGSSPVVLVVEDNAELRHVLKEAFTAEGYRVLVARDETEALELLRAHEVDLLISDLTDPPDSRRTIEVLAKDFPDLPVVALAGAAGYHPTLFFSAWGNRKGHRTLSKPFRLGQLLAVSREVLGPSDAQPSG